MSFEDPQTKEVNTRATDREAESVTERRDLLSETKEKYKTVIDLRDTMYKEDKKKDPENNMLKGMHKSLEVHNDIVFGYAAELVEEHEMSQEDKVAALLATALHDSGKLVSGLMDHHTAGVSRTEDIVDKLIGENQEFEGVEITPEIKEKVANAVERHMNHPFLVMLKKGEMFPEPENDVDKVVYDADMLANVGFKNVGFRLITEDFLNQDAKKAKKQGTTVLEQSFEDVMNGAPVKMRGKKITTGVRSLDQVVLLPESKQKAKELIDASEKVFEFLKEQGVMAKVQEEFSTDGKFDISTIAEKGGTAGIKKRINEEVLKASDKLGIERKVANSFLL